jgi:oxalate decarboxylase/phosphoglucose isomerase-like protein (cupin superfamily)
MRSPGRPWLNEEDARTFGFRAGDVGYVPFAMGHYVENTGTTTLRFLEMFKSASYADNSRNQWMALTPPQRVRAHLELGAEGPAVPAWCDARPARAARAAITDCASNR